MTSPFDPLSVNRRHFFKQASAGIGGMALGSMLAEGESMPLDKIHDIAPKAKRIIYLFQSGGPSHFELFDDKPLLRENHGQELPQEMLKTLKPTGMSANQSSMAMAGSKYEFRTCGQSGQRISNLLPYHQEIADDICIMRNVYTEAINHDPAITFFQTGSQIAGRPSFGSWMSYGLGSMNKDLPDFVVMVSKNSSGQPLYSRLWGSGFLDSKYGGVNFLPGEERMLYLSNPDGVCGSGRRAMLDKLSELNRSQYEAELDPEIESRIAQYELAYRLQTSVPEVSDLSTEPEETFELYGEDARDAGTYAANCLQARRLAERGVRFIQLYHQGWDHHGGLPGGIEAQAKKVDQASAALVKDLKQRGMLEDTLVVWGGEFGRTAYSQGRITKNNYGRDHHPNCFSMWMAGGGIKPGINVGRTDDYGINIVDADGQRVHANKHDHHLNPDAIHVHDLQATIMHQMGVDHTKLTYKFQGRRFRLTDVHGFVVDHILA